ncbi:MAG: cyclodeaminase/cyclohydrolase family protein [Planctomycetota bacterium]
MPDDTPIATRTIEGFLGSLAHRSPAPGGGATAAVAGALAAAQASMVVAYSRGKKSLADHAAAHAEIEAILERARADLMDLADADAIAYAEMNRLQRLPDGDPERNRLPEAARACVDVPVRVQEACAAMLDAGGRLAPIANRWLLSDLAIAAMLAEATVRCSDRNIRVNAGDLGDAGPAAVDQSGRRCDDAARAMRSILSAIDEATG